MCLIEMKRRNRTDSLYGGRTALRVNICRHLRWRLAIVNYIGFHDKRMLLAGGCGDINGKPQIDKTNHLAEAYEFGGNIYR